MVRRTTWITLAVLVTVILTAVILNQTQNQQSPPAVTPEPDPLWSVASEDIVALTVEDLTASNLLQFERSAEELWRMVLPQQGEADIASVERAVSWLSAPSPRAQLTEVDDLSVFQLDAPDYRVELELSSGERLSFIVGRETPTGGSRYIASPDVEGIWIISTFGLDEVLGLLEFTELAPTEAPDA